MDLRGGRSDHLTPLWAFLEAGKTLSTSTNEVGVEGQKGFHTGVHPCVHGRGPILGPFPEASISTFESFTPKAGKDCGGGLGAQQVEIEVVCTPPPSRKRRGDFQPLRFHVNIQSPSCEMDWAETPEDVWGAQASAPLQACYRRRAGHR